MKKKKNWLYFSQNVLIIVLETSVNIKLLFLVLCFFAFLVEYTEKHANDPLPVFFVSKTN